ncbi:MAG: hypothetical protein OEZ32_05965 [Nitrospinota bacterium]|nr:hypothetical protein [Nitrospinota bacterium]
MNNYRMAAFGIVLMAVVIASDGCIEGNTQTSANFGGTYQFITEPVNMKCQEKTTGLSVSITPIPRQEFKVDITQDGGDILLYSNDFNWNWINLRQDAAAAASGGDSTYMTGQVAEDGSFSAESTDTWPNDGSAGPVDIRQRFEGAFTDEGVIGKYFVDLFLHDYNTECHGSAGFTGNKLN